MRIGFDTRFITRQKTGLGNYSRSLLEKLLTRDADYDFVLFADGDPDAYTPTAGRFEVVGVRRPSMRVNGAIGAIFKEQILLADAIRKTEIDLMHFPYYLEPAFVKKPFIFTVHDMYSHSALNTRALPTKLYHRFLIRVLAARCEALITDSNFSRDEILYEMPGLTSKVHVVPFGVPETFYLDNDSGAADAVPEGDYLLYAGGMGMRKNLWRMVDAFAITVKNSNHGVRLVIAGGENEICSAIRSYVHERRLDGDVIFPGYVPDHQLSALYRDSVAALYPSLYEGFGLPVLEALSSGTPIITTRDSSMAEIAGGKAILVDPFDTISIAAAIQTVLDNRGLADRLGALGPARAAKFTWDAAADQVLSIYESVLR